MEEQQNKLSAKRKLAVFGLAVFAILIIIMWVASFRNIVYGPFKYKPLAQTDLCPNGNCGDNEEDLKNKDTDNDGLSDWEELYVYGTSPYLEDSDSDGISDYDEIMAGTDPNCPRGNDCGSSGDLMVNAPADENSDLSDLDNLKKLDDLLLSFGEAGMGVEAGEQGEEKFAETLAGKASATELRKLLLESGMDKALLDQISDEILMESYQEILNENK